MNPKLSIVIPTHNRINMLVKLISSIHNKLDGFEYEIVVADDASSDGTRLYFENLDDTKISYVRNEINRGVFKNILLGLTKASAEAVWVISDDDDIGDASFATDGASIINNNEADLVFGKMAVKYTASEKVSTHLFKPSYSSQEFLASWFENINYLCFSSMLYKKSILLECFPSIDGYMGNTLDYHVIYHVAKRSKNIIFLDKIAYIWTKSQPTSLSGKSKNDLMLQMMNIFAFPMANFSETQDYDIDFFNQYILKATDTLVSSYHMSNNDKTFAIVREWIKSSKLKTIYIYGKGEVGLALEEYLLCNGVVIESFIDDFAQDTEVLSYDSFILQNSLLDNNIGIVIATYKCSIATSIINKIHTNGMAMSNIISLYSIVTRGG